MTDTAEIKSAVERELAEHGVYASNTSGVSMRPLFKTHRDMVILRPPRRPLRKYDVVLYTAASGKYIMHRIIGFKGDICIIRGDNTYRREYVEKSRIIAVLTEFNRKGKRHSCDETAFKIYSRLWNFIYPLRFVVHGAYSVVRRCLAGLYRRIFGHGYSEGKTAKQDKTK